MTVTLTVNKKFEFQKMLQRVPLESTHSPFSFKDFQKKSKFENAETKSTKT